MNRLSWNAAAKAHNAHKCAYKTTFEAGHDFLPPEIRAALPDIMGKRVVHLFCNDGREVFSLERLGASVTGVDFSEQALKWAFRTRREIGSSATFCCQEVGHWMSMCPAASFDLVYISLGSLWWIADLDRFFKNLTRILTHEGEMLWWDFHPDVNKMDSQMRRQNRVTSGGRMRKQKGGIVDYIGQAGRVTGIPLKSVGSKMFRNSNPAFEFLWSLSDMRRCATRAGLPMTSTVELPYCIGERWFAKMDRKNGYQFWPRTEMRVSLNVVLNFRKT